MRFSVVAASEAGDRRNRAKSAKKQISTLYCEVLIFTCLYE